MSMNIFGFDDDVDVYTKLTEYYDLADSLANSVEENQDISLDQKREILYPIIDEIKDMADVLIESYIFHLKDKDNMEKLLKVKENINNILKKIDYFRNKIYDVYKINNRL